MSLLPYWQEHLLLIGVFCLGMAGYLCRHWAEREDSDPC